MATTLTLDPGANAKIAAIVAVHIKRKIAPALKNAIAERAPGSLAKSVAIRTTALGAEVGYFGDEFKKAVYVTGGTQPHVIRAKSKGAMVFFWDKVGQRTVVPSKPVPFTGSRGGVFWIGKGFVNHPGYEGNDFVRAALASIAASGQFFRGAGGRFVSGR